MANLSIHKIFMDNVQTIKNIQISNGEFHPDNEVTTINKLEMKDFFRWLSESVKVVSNNNGQRITKSYNNWNE